MTSPRLPAKITIFPSSEEIMVDGKLFRNPQVLWDYLMEKANPIMEKVSIPQVFRNSPEIEEYLARGGKITKPAEGATTSQAQKIKGLDPELMGKVLSSAKKAVIGDLIKSTLNSSLSEESKATRIAEYERRLNT